MNPKLIKARLNKIWANKVEADLLAEEVQIPEATAAWLDDLDSRLNAAPATVQDEFRPVIEKRTKQAREAIENGDGTLLKQALFVLYENFHRLNRDTEIVNQYEGRTRGGKADKRSQWAEDLAYYLAGLGVSFPKAWESIPEDENTPLALDEDTAVYRTNEGKTVVAFDRVNDGEVGKPQSRDNFEKRYYRPAKKSGQQLT